MELRDEKLMMAQDHRSLESSLLVIMEALETGHWPKSFLLYHDEWIGDVMREIAMLLKEKYGVEVEEGEI